MEELLKNIRDILGNICKKQGLKLASERKLTAGDLHGSFVIEMGDYDNVEPYVDTCSDKWEINPVITIRNYNGGNETATNLWIDTTKSGLKVLINNSIMTNGELDKILFDAIIVKMTKKELDESEAKFDINLKLTAFIKRGE